MCDESPPTRLDCRLSPVQSLALSPSKGTAQLRAARNFLGTRLARTDGYLDAYPQPLGKHRYLTCKHPDAYSASRPRTSQSAPSAVPSSLKPLHRAQLFGQSNTNTPLAQPRQLQPSDAACHWAACSEIQSRPLSQQPRDRPYPVPNLLAATHSVRYVGRQSRRLPCSGRRQLLISNRSRRCLSQAVMFAPMRVTPSRTSTARHAKGSFSSLAGECSRRGWPASPGCR